MGHYLTSSLFLIRLLTIQRFSSFSTSYLGTPIFSVIIRTFNHHHLNGHSCYVGVALIINDFHFFQMLLTSSYFLFLHRLHQYRQSLEQITFQELVQQLYFMLLCLVYQICAQSINLRTMSFKSNKNCFCFQDSNCLRIFNFEFLHSNFYIYFLRLITHLKSIQEAEMVSESLKVIKIVCVINFQELMINVGYCLLTYWNSFYL